MSKTFDFEAFCKNASSSTETRDFVDRSSKICTLSIKRTVFMDKTHHLTSWVLIKMLPDGNPKGSIKYIR